MSTATRPAAAPGAKMIYLIRRRPGVSREELIAHWFANHMPEVIGRQQQQADAGRPAARRYLASLFDPEASGQSEWDGMAQLWFDEPLPMPEEPHGTSPTDSFQERAEPYLPWATVEYVVLDGALPLSPLTLNPPFPCTRSGFCKVTLLVVPKEGADLGALYDHWLDVHLPSVVQTMQHTGGFRYLVSHSLNPETAPYAGMAELYFPDPSAWQAFIGALPSDGIEAYIERLEIRIGGTEMIGIP